MCVCVCVCASVHACLYPCERVGEWVSNRTCHFNVYHCRYQIGDHSHLVLFEVIEEKVAIGANLNSNFSTSSTHTAEDYSVVIDGSKIGSFLTHFWRSTGFWSVMCCMIIIIYRMMSLTLYSCLCIIRVYTCCGYSVISKNILTNYITI